MAIVNRKSIRINLEKINFKKININIIFFIFLFIYIWLLGIMHFYTSNRIIDIDINYNKENSFNYFTEENIIGIKGYDVTDNKYFAIDDDPYLFIKPPKQKISNIFIEFSNPILTDANIQLYYAKENEDVFEYNSVITEIPSGSINAHIILPEGIYTTLRFDINIFSEYFEINCIYFIEPLLNITYNKSNNINFTGIIIALLISLSIIITYKFNKKYNLFNRIGFSSNKIHILHILLFITWIIGLSNYFLSITAYMTTPIGKRIWSGNCFDGIYYILFLDVFIIILWYFGNKYGYIDILYKKSNEIFTYKKIKSSIKYFILILFITFLLEIILTSFILKNHFNYYRYFFFFITGFVIYTIYKHRKKPEKLFLFISLSIGILYIITLPPMTYVSWDEDVHYSRSLENSFVNNIYTTKADDIIYPHQGIYFLIYNTKQFVNNSILNKNTLYKSEITIKNKSQNNFINNIVYISTGFMLFLGRSLNLPYHIIFILGRIGNLLVYSIVIYFAIKRLNGGKYLMSLIALLPTSFIIAVTYSYDQWLLAWSMLGFSYFFYEVQNPRQKISTKNIFIILLSLFLAVSVKQVYFPIIFLLYFISYKKFNTTKEYNNYIKFVTITISVLVCSFIIPFLINKGGEGDLRGGLGINPGEQLRFILNNPLKYTRILLNFIKSYLSFNNYRNFSISLAHFDYFKHSSFSFYIIFSIFIILFFTDTTKSDIYIMKIKYKLLFSLFTFISICLIATALYLSFTPVSAQYIAGVQARYLLPFIFPLFYIMKSSKIVININKNIYSPVVFGIISFILLNNIWVLCVSKY